MDRTILKPHTMHARRPVKKFGIKKIVFAPYRIEEKRRTDKKRDSTNTERHIKKLNFYAWKN